MYVIDSQFGRLGREVTSLIQTLQALQPKLDRRFAVCPTLLQVRIDLFCQSRLWTCESIPCLIETLRSVGELLQVAGLIDRLHRIYTQTPLLLDALPKITQLGTIDTRQARLLWDILYELRTQGALTQKDVS